MPGRLTLLNARLPARLLAGTPSGASGYCDRDIAIAEGRIAALHESGGKRSAPALWGDQGVAFGEAPDGTPAVLDLGGGIVLPALVDCHAHIDKAHVADRGSYPEFGLLEAIAAMRADKARWSPDDLVRRAGFALRSAHALGVRAVRSHVDWQASTPDFVAPVLSRLRQDWAGRIDLQLAPLSSIDEADDAALAETARRFAAGNGGVVGYFVYAQPRLEQRLEGIMDAAAAAGLDLDFHIDEGLDPALDGLARLARLLHRRPFPGRVLCGHCVSLALLPPGELAPLLAEVAAAGIHTVSLPLTNLALQDRHPARDPLRRGIAPLRAMAAAGIPVSIATDNVRDGFFAFGDHDPLATLAVAAFAAHLPAPLAAWGEAITRAPARAMGLAWDGTLAEGAPADLVLFDGRSDSEVLARFGHPRRVLRAGRFVAARPPSHRELDT